MLSQLKLTYCKLVLIGLFSFFYIGCETTPIRTSPTQGEPIAYSPKMRVGDNWVYEGWSRKNKRDTYRNRIVEVSEDGSFVIEIRGETSGRYKHRYYDNKFRWVKTIDKKTEKILKTKKCKYNKSWFPLFVGKKWVEECYLTSSVSGRKDDYKLTYIVQSYEKVKTKAGIFEAFKIKELNWVIGSTSQKKWRRIYWYSPQVKRTVKVESNYQYWSDLIKFSLAKLDATAPVISVTHPDLREGDPLVHTDKAIIKGQIEDSSSIKWLKVNDKTIPLNDQNTFAYSVVLSSGLNAFRIEAEDEYGNKAVRRVNIRYELPKYISSPKISTLDQKQILKLHSVQPARWAVVIGISQYQDDRIPKLKYTARDAKEFYALLTDPQYGDFSKVQVKLLINEQATYNNIKSAIGTWLKRNAKKDDTVIIFFAGHGAPEEIKKYWITYNANIDDLYGTALSNDEITDMFDRIEARKTIAFLDSCYSAATINRTGKKRGIIVGDPFQEFKGKGKGRVVITSSDGKEQSLEIDEFRHGVFTYYLLKALKGEADKNNDGFIDLEEVWDYVKYRVTNTARQYGIAQTPIMDGKYSAGILLSKNPKRLKQLQIETERQKKRKELERKIAKLTELYSKGEITSGQFDKAIRLLKSGEKNKILNDFLSNNISLTTFKTVFK